MRIDRFVQKQPYGGLMTFVKPVISHFHLNTLLQEYTQEPKTSKMLMWRLEGGKARTETCFPPVARN